jgi:hypothetical protein
MTRKRIEWKWEQLDETTWRAQVYGGWIVKFADKKSVCMEFVSDRDSEWTIIPIKSDEPKIQAKALAKEYEPA